MNYISHRGDGQENLFCKLNEISWTCQGTLAVGGYSILDPGGVNLSGVHIPGTMKTLIPGGQYAWTVTAKREGLTFTPAGHPSWQHTADKTATTGVIWLK